MAAVAWCPQGETPDEIAGLARAMHDLSVPVTTSCDGGRLVAAVLLLAEWGTHAVA